MNEILVQSPIVIECYTSFSDTSYMFSVPEDMNHSDKWLFICVNRTLATSFLMEKKAAVYEQTPTLYKKLYLYKKVIH